LQQLVWSGACQVNNQNACDFRLWNLNGTDYLSTILYKFREDSIGHGIIMDNSYKVVKEILPPPETPGFNMHELSLVDNGTAAVYFTFRPEYVNISDITDQTRSHGWIMNMGIREVDLRDGQTTFEWWAYPDVSLRESNVAVEHLNGPYPQGWNWFHGNSIVKNSHGDYLISSRYTDTIFKLSGGDGKILWRLGGRYSDFELVDFNFSRQHDAQWIEGECDGDTETITFLDNGSDGITSTANISHGLKVRLEKGPMTAKVLQRWPRPDNKRSNLRGNLQNLPGGNVFAAWSDNSFISEHTSTGDLVMASEFSSKRFVTYRAYKFNFTGAPWEEPIIKAFVYGADAATSTTVIYMSWNGATEIEWWDLYRPVPQGAKGGGFIGSIIRTGFETRFQTSGFESEVYAEAVAADGTVLGRTATFTAESPPEWEWEWEQVEVEEMGEGETGTGPTAKKQSEPAVEGLAWEPWVEKELEKDEL
jgi:hypothetical protein